MSEIAALYLIAWLPPVALLGAYFLVRFLLRNDEKKWNLFRKIFVYTSAAIMGISLFVAYYIRGDAMEPYTPKGEPGLSGFRPNIGCFELVGVPYGDNKVANFFAFFQSYLFLPIAFSAFLFSFYSFKTGRLLTKWVLLPASIIQAAFVFNLVNAYYGEITLELAPILYALCCGFMVALAAILFFENRKEKFEGRTSALRFAFFILIALMCCVPTYTAAMFVPADMQLFGMPLSHYQIYDFTELHRIFLYMTFLTRWSFISSSGERKKTEEGRSSF